MKHDEKKSGFEEEFPFGSDVPESWKDGESCLDPEHNPPMHLHIPLGKIYRHVCPSCGAEKVLRPPRITYSTSPTMISLSLRDVMNRGHWDQLCELKGWDVYCLNEGKAGPDEMVNLTEDEAKKIGITVSHS